MNARAYLRSRSWLGQRFGLRTMRALVRELGHPERAFRSVLVAGTNGKGSVSAYLDAGLRASGLKVGRYTSPHLVDVRERIMVSGRRIGRPAFERSVLEVRDCSEALIQKGVLREHPNHFEILTLAAFLHFRRVGVEFAVLEVGLGGRLDATNVADPLVSAIVSVDFDHEEYLGRTLSAIATEKAGVLRRNRAAVLGPLAAEASRAIAAAAEAKGARLIRSAAGARIEPARGGFHITTPGARYPDLRPLPGAHQRANLLVAIRTIEALAAAGLPIDPKRCVAAMSGVVWPGRLERIPGRPPFLLDGAHNPAGARALADYLKETGTRHLLIFGAMRDKHISDMARALFPLARKVLATRVRMKRAATTADLRKLGEALQVEVEEHPTIQGAVSAAARAARAGEMVVVAGSLYLVGAVRRRLMS